MWIHLLVALVWLIIAATAVCYGIAEYHFRLGCREDEKVRNFERRLYAESDRLVHLLDEDEDEEQHSPKTRRRR